MKMNNYDIAGILQTYAEKAIKADTTKKLQIMKLNPKQ